ncbi:response regulator [Methanospirillum lacunae]|uniref:Two-component system response regulator n=1 Tax=Methanospirillum lacunae TaxID=668570 RepID=A0A2V2MUA6_9EURY|nr:response regulator [Methanospirillum lacunae]PWR71532.1 two-component system response regulator [Methanospirillum lacunae]
MTTGLKVLYIDDEALLKMAFVETLKQQGYDARGAISGKEALELIDAEIPDIIILDVMMKPMDGWETLSHIKNNEETRHVPIIMQTGKSLTIKDVMKYGDQIEDYLIKPVRLPDLVKSVEGVRERKEMISREMDQATAKGGDSNLIVEYSNVRHRTLIGKRLITILGRIYPIRTDGTIETDFDMPELHDIINRFEEERKRCRELHKILLE